jgi:hypothetical protein
MDKDSKRLSPKPKRKKAKKRFQSSDMTDEAWEDFYESSSFVKNGIARHILDEHIVRPLDKWLVANGAIPNDEVLIEHL